MTGSHQPKHLGFDSLVVQPNLMEKRIMYQHLKRFITTYRTRKSYDPMMLRIFEILLAEIESEIISYYMKGKHK
jgi:NADPH-dependent 7-cyano-7-deazaguanine reductase QueF